MSTENKETTVVEKVELDIDQFLNETLGADNILLPEDKKPSLFSKQTVDTSFIDKPGDNKLEDSKKEEIDEVIAEITTDDLILDDEKSKSNVGRAKIAKDGTVELVKKLIEAGKLIPFEDEKPIEEYSLNDFEELLEANFNEKERQIKEKTPVEFFESLPDELKVAAKYVSDGGQDLKGLFKVLAQVEESRELDPKNANDQERIVREYLTSTNFGTAEEIDEEIESWKDREELEAKALKFKPKLDAMQSRLVEQKLVEQAALKKRQQDQAQKYMSNVYETLKPGEINGIKLDRRTQELLYTGLVQPNYPSISGRPTNMLGHLLEKYQFVEPRHDLIAEALWLLSDPDSYKAKVKESGATEQAKETARMLKTEGERRATGSPVIEKEETKQRRIPRNNNFFKR